MHGVLKLASGDFLETKGGKMGGREGGERRRGGGGRGIFIDPLLLLDRGSQVDLTTWSSSAKKRTLSCIVCSCACQVGIFTASSSAPRKGAERRPPLGASQTAHRRKKKAPKAGIKNTNKKKKNDNCNGKRTLVERGGRGRKEREWGSPARSNTCAAITWTSPRKWLFCWTGEEGSWGGEGVNVSWKMRSLFLGSFHWHSVNIRSAESKR